MFNTTINIAVPLPEPNNIEPLVSTPVARPISLPVPGKGMMVGKGKGKVKGKSNTQIKGKGNGEKGKGKVKGKGNVQIKGKGKASTWTRQQREAIAAWNPDGNDGGDANDGLP